MLWIKTCASPVPSDLFQEMVFPYESVDDLKERYTRRAPSGVHTGNSSFMAPDVMRFRLPRDQSCTQMSVWPPSRMSKAIRRPSGENSALYHSAGSARSVVSAPVRSIQEIGRASYLFRPGM